MFRESQQIGRYTLIRKLGEGGFGEVWLAENRNHSPIEKVAIKLPRKEQIDFSAVKEEIFNWTISGKHKNILPIIECEVFNNQIAIVSEYAPDGSLQDLINKKGALPLAEAVEIIIGILEGLAHLHNRKIIHRDLKPDNVLFKGKTPCLTDFGISRALPINSDSKTNAGTPNYMAPEALNKKRNELTDIWSVGIILYQLLAGKLPFPQDDISSLIAAVLYSEPESLPPNIPPALQKIIMKALKKEPVKRYQTANEIRNDLIPFAPVTKESDILTPDKPYLIDLILTKEFYLYLFIFTIFSLFLLIFISFGFLGSDRRSAKENDTISNSTIKSPTPSPTASPIKDKNGEIILVPFRKGDKWGFSDSNKTLIIEAIYDDVQPFSEGLAVVALEVKEQSQNNNSNIKDKPSKENNTQKRIFNYGYVNQIGKQITDIMFESAAPFKDGVGKVKFDNKDQFYNEVGKQIPTPQKSPPPLFPPKIIPKTSENWTYAMDDNGRYYFVDINGNSVLKFKFDDAWNFSDGVAPVKVKGKWGFIGMDGKFRVEPVFTEATKFENGFSAVKDSSGKWGYYSCIEKRIVISPMYEKVNSFFDGKAKAKKDNKWGIIDLNNNVKIEFLYEDLGNFKDGFLVAKYNGKWGIIDEKKVNIIDFKYEKIELNINQGNLIYPQILLARVKDDKGNEFYIGKDKTEYYAP